MAAVLPETFMELDQDCVETFRLARQRLVELLPTGYPSVTVLAAALGLSVRTFQRRLAAARTSYSALVDQTRLQVALEKLATSDASIREISASLGYRDPASFSRAFRRWKGRAPSDLRGELLASADRRGRAG